MKGKNTLGTTADREENEKSEISEHIMIKLLCDASTMFERMTG